MRHFIGSINLAAGIFFVFRLLGVVAVLLSLFGQDRLGFARPDQQLPFAIARLGSVVHLARKLPCHWRLNGKRSSHDRALPTSVLSRE